MKPYENLSRTLLVCVLAFLVNVFSASDLVLAQQSTTGPVPPVGIDRGIKIPTLQQITIPGVPSYIWHHGCGPTAVGMVVGYWDGNGFPNLVPGDASNQTVAVDAMIADDSENPDCAQPDGDHYQDYSCPLDYWPDPILPDRSETGGAHSSNCVGDYMETSWSSESNYYGWSWFSDVAPSFVDYVNFVEPAYVPCASGFDFADFSFADYMAEIDAGRPVVLLVDTDGDENTDHFVTGIGYDNSTVEYGVFDTWDNSVHWFDWAPIGSPWGIYGTVTFTIWPIVDCQTVYETDFSSDPFLNGWITNNPEDYYWDSGSQSLFTDNYTNSGDWATTDINYNGESFCLTFDVLPMREVEENGDVDIGLFGPTRYSNGDNTEERLFVMFGGYDEPGVGAIYIYGFNSGGEVIWSGPGTGLMLNGAWHHVEVTYDSETMVLTLKVTRDDVIVLCWHTAMNYGFSSDLLYLGVSMAGEWETSGRHEIAYIDNMTFGLGIQNIPTLSQWGMLILGLLLLAAGTIAVIRRREEAFANEH